MKNILNRFLLVTLLALPATQVYGQEVAIKENKIENAKIFTEKHTGGKINAALSAGLLSYSAIISYFMLRNIIALKDKPLNDQIKVSLFLSLLATTGAIATGDALKLSPEIIKKSPDFLQKAENQIKDFRSNILKLMKKNSLTKLTGLSVFSFHSALTGVVAISIWRKYPLWSMVIAGSSIISGHLAFDLAKNK